MKTIGWGIIGCGKVTEVKSGPGFQQATHARLVAVMRRNGALAADYARRHGVPKSYDDAEALLRDPAVDAVYVATPPSSHRTYVLAAARAGKPVYVEKPMALDHAECQAMIHACREAGVPLFVAYYRRALPRFLKVKALIESGAIGEVLLVTVLLCRRPLPAEVDARALPWRLVPEISGGGLFLDVASHTLDFLDFALGPIRSAQGCASNHDPRYRAEDLVTGTFVFESGVHGTGAWCFTAAEDRDLVEVLGTRGRVSFSSFTTEPIVLHTPAGDTAFPIPNPPSVQQPLIQTMVDELNGAGRCPSTGLTAARTTWVMDEMLKGYRQRA